MKDFFDSYKIVFDLVQWLFMGAVGLVTWQMKRDKTQDTQISDFRQEFMDKVAEHEVRLAHIDEKLKHVPSSTETAALTERLNSLDKSIVTLNQNIGRVNEFLLNNR